MKYLSVCSGIEAVTCAWHDFATPVAFVEYDKFPAAVLAHHYDVPNLGDLTEWRTWDKDMLAQVDVLVGGTPCQAFSIAGLRQSLDDERGNLSLIFLELADAIDNIRCDRGKPPITILWENVPGVLSTGDNAFGCFLAGMAGSDAPLEPNRHRGWTYAGVVSGPKRAIAWRCLDAQYFGLAQRRMRLFVVASSGGGAHPSEILLEREGVRRDSPPSREAGQRVAPGVTSGPPFSRTGNERVEADAMVPEGSHWDGNDVHPCLNQSHNTGSPGYSNQELFSQRGGGLVQAFGQNNTQGPNDISHGLNCNAGVNNPGDFEAGTLLVQEPIAFQSMDSLTQRNKPGPVCSTLDQGKAGGHAVAYGIQGCWIGRSPEHGGNAVEPMVELAPGLTTMDRHAVVFDTTQVTHPANHSNPKPGDPCHPLAAGAHAPAVAFSIMPMNSGKDYKAREVEVSQPVMTTPVGGNQGGDYVKQDMQVRRLTPVECERLQGFPDNYTRIAWRGKPEDQCPDGPRYKALGNSMAVPVMAWIGRRIHDLS